MVHSVKNRKKKEKKMRTLRKWTEKLAKLASHQMEEVVEMTLPYIALGDLRRRWRQKETPLHPVLLKKLDKFKRIKIQKDKPLCISGCRQHLHLSEENDDDVNGISISWL